MGEGNVKVRRVGGIEVGVGVCLNNADMALAACKCDELNPRELRLFHWRWYRFLSWRGRGYKLYIRHVTVIVCHPWDGVWVGGYLKETDWETRVFDLDSAVQRCTRCRIVVTFACCLRVTFGTIPNTFNWIRFSHILVFSGTQVIQGDTDCLFA